MHIINTTKAIDMGPSVGTIEPGEYLLDDINAGKLLLSYRESVSLKSMQLPILKEGHAKSILFVGGLAFGDQLMFMPVVNYMREIGWERIAVSLFKGYREVFDEFEAYVNPVPVAALDAFDAVVSIEDAFSVQDKHLTDVFADLAGVSLVNKIHKYVVPETYSQFVNGKYPRNGKKRIGVQVSASSPARVYPRMNELIDKLLKEGYEIFLFGAPGEVKTPEKHESVINLTEDGLTFKQSVAVLDSCDGFIGADSALLHYAGSLSKPSVGLYGPFDWKYRTSYYPSVFSIQGDGGCEKAPCHHHSWISPFPNDGPCRKKGYCLPLANITPDRIISKLKQILS